MTVTAIGLMSGGLDSTLAARVLMDQAIQVVGVSFTTPFFGPQMAEAAARQVGFPLIVRDITGVHMEVVKAPPSGYGANMNPCIDCHALMVREAGRIMEQEGWDFIFTGEVLNERPFSQTRPSLNRVANLSGYAGLVLRPLSARLLAETVPEREGKVDRSRLLDIQGRSRKRQMALAEQYGITDYPTPAGGCLLTDPAFSRRLRDLLDGGPDSSTRHVEMLKTGRHFRLRRGVKAVVGRNSAENRRLEELRGDEDYLLRAAHVPGPVTILSGSPSREDLLVAAALCARYSDARSPSVGVTIEGPGTSETVEARPFSGDLLESLRI